MGDTAGSDEHHAVSGVVGLDIVDEVVSLDACNIFLGAEDGASKRLSLESSRVEVIKDNLFQLLVNLFLFTEDHIPLPFDCARVKFRVLEDIGQDVNGFRDVGVK